MLLLVWGGQSRAQQTIFNVPSPDILERGAVYGEFDLFVRPSETSFSFTPRLVVGVGHNLEAGVNIIGAAEPATGEYVLSPAVKWKFYDGSSNGWSVFMGSNFFIPVHKRRYAVGTYSYLEVAKRIGTGTRFGVGASYFSPHVVAEANRAGGQFSVEQKLSSTLSIAADWFTGKHANGFFTTGLIWNMTKKVTVYGAYALGNAGAMEGNRGPLFEVGYQF